MPRKQLVRPHITIVGAGNLAGALAVSLHDAGYRIDQIVSRGTGPSLRRSRQLAKEVGATAVTAITAQIHAEVVWFCVPDAQIANAAASLTKAADWHGKVALHSSGALTSDELAALHRRGASTASVHPLMTFVSRSRPSLNGVPFALEGKRRAVQVARRIIADLHGEPFILRKQQKGAYHAWGMFASPLLTSLLAASENVAAAAGINREAARKRMLPILRQTLANYESLGARASFSGPIARGDAETVKNHLRTLRKIPGLLEVYVALVRVALRNLPAKNRAAMKAISEELTA